MYYPDETCLCMYTNHSLQISEEFAHFATVSAYNQCHHLLSLVFECFWFFLFHCCFLGQSSKDVAGNPHAEWMVQACCSRPE